MTYSYFGRDSNPLQVFGVLHLQRGWNWTESSSLISTRDMTYSYASHDSYPLQVFKVLICREGCTGLKALSFLLIPSCDMTYLYVSCDFYLLQVFGGLDAAHPELWMMEGLDQRPRPLRNPTSPFVGRVAPNLARTQGTHVGGSSASVLRHASSTSNAGGPVFITASISSSAVLGRTSAASGQSAAIYQVGPSTATHCNTLQHTATVCQSAAIYQVGPSSSQGVFGSFSGWEQASRPSAAQVKVLVSTRISLSLSLSHTQTHTHTLSLSLSHTHTNTHR